jgi:CrcB protein
MGMGSPITAAKADDSYQPRESADRSLAVQAYILVFLGGGIGAAIRHGINVTVARTFGTAFPLATLIENISGSFLMGVLIGYFAFKSEAPQALRLFLTTGILGGYTTFSTFSLDAALLWERGETGKAISYVLLSVAGSLVGIAVGLLIVRRVVAGYG